MFYLSVSILNKFLGLSAPLPVRLFFRSLVCFGGLTPFGDCHQASVLASSRFCGCLGEKERDHLFAVKRKDFDHLILLFLLCPESHLLQVN